ncbi:unnamed protein product, partial [Brachionus calyciflorus]
MHDLKNHNIIPFAEFVSTAHDQITISRYLFTIKSKLIIDLLPEIVVVDMSWALINSISNIFNSCDILTYLKLSFEKLLVLNNEKFEEVIKVKVYLCSTHFLNSVIKKAKKIKVKNNVRNAFIFSFTLVQNSKTIQELENYLINIFNIFNNQYFDRSVVYSLNTLKIKIRERNLSNLDISGERNPEKLSRDIDFKKFLKGTNENIGEKEEIIFRNSPFKTYFDELISKYKVRIQKTTSKYMINNEYFCPDLFNILENKLYLVPLWTGILINCSTIEYPRKTRLTNNPVENYFS